MKETLHWKLSMHHLTLCTKMPPTASKWTKSYQFMVHEEREKQPTYSGV